MADFPKVSFLLCSHKQDVAEFLRAAMKLLRYKTWQALLKLMPVLVLSLSTSFLNRLQFYTSVYLFLHPLVCQ